MTASKSRRHALAIGTAGLLLTSVLSACNSAGTPAPAPSDPGSGDASDAAALPLSTTTPVTASSAPPVTALPSARPVRIRQMADRRESYAYLDRAYYQEDAVEDAPPDYSFDDGGVRPWAWATSDGSRVITEPVAGGYRYYYYQAGSETPYLVRDPQYSYAYDNGALISVFSPNGQQIDLVAGSEPVMYAGRYLDRGNMLWRASSTREHVPVNAYAWSDRRADLAAQRVAWHQQYGDNPDWVAWNGAHHDEEQRYWNDDRVQHEAAAQQFGTWQQQRFQGPPPQLYSQPQNHANHTAAIVGGVVAAGVAAVAAHEIFSHHNDRNQAPAPQPQRQQQQQQPAQYHPGNPATGYHAQGQQPGNRAPDAVRAEPRYAPPAHAAAQPGHQIAPQHAQPYAHPAQRPMERAAPAPAVAAGRAREVAPPHPAEHAPPHAMDHAAPQRPMERPMERPAPRPAEQARPAPHPEQPRPHGNGEHEHGPHQDH